MPITRCVSIHIFFSINELNYNYNFSICQKSHYINVEELLCALNLELC